LALNEERVGVVHFDKADCGFDLVVVQQFHALYLAVRNVRVCVVKVKPQHVPEQALVEIGSFLARRPD
jgi:hypothetical protein